MEELLQIIQRVAERSTQRIHTSELGVVTAVFSHADEGDNDNYQCSVQLRNYQLPDGGPFELRKVPVATPYLGLACIPNVGDLVVLSFIGGDINAPIIMGRVYNDEDRPPANNPKEFLLQHSIAEGGSLLLDSEGKIILTSKNGENTITLEDEKIAISNEKFSLVIDLAGEKISLSSNKDLSLIAETGKLTVQANAIELKSDSTLDLQASGAIKIKGSTIDLN
ncbi:MAG: phage baseplate assembly protein V [Chloroflexi bacterium]|nr:phage baseplate assembly protein V [Chloroflexota bacterium]